MAASSPFPGMDPYLEGSEWMSFHAAFAIEIGGQLSEKLPDNYIARAERDMVVRESDGVSIFSTGRIVPDASLVAEPRAGYSAPSVGVLERPLTRTSPMPERRPQYSIEIRSADGDELITAIEILSPSNKIGEGREEYLSKRGRLLISEAHLVEIDLIRRGTRLPVDEPLPDYPYFLYVSRAGRRPNVEIWPVALEEALPILPVPIRSPDPDTELDLQLALDNVCKRFRIPNHIDYSKPPPAPLLSSNQRQWAIERLRSQGYSPAW